MRIALSALGTRGDVLPYVVLGRALRAAGHDVLLATMERFRTLVEESELSFRRLPGDPEHVFHAGRIDVSPRRPLRHVRVVHAAVEALVTQTDPEFLRDAWADRDLVIFTGSTTFAHFVARDMGLPSAMVVMTPGAATGAFAHPVLTPGLAFGRHGNLASWLLAERLQKQTFQEPLKPAARRRFGLPAFALGTGRSETGWPPFPLLHAYSAEVVPRPSDWPEHVSVTGWLLPDASSEPLSEPVERFLGDGPPPLYIGFGSMPVPEGEKVARMLVAALRRTGHRAIVAGADIGRAVALQGLDDRVLTAEELPHERLLHRVRAVVHHGGSGTVGAGLRAGRPTLVTPFVFDQFFWGERVKRVGAGPAPIPFRSLSEHRLARGLADLTSGRYDAAATRIGERIRAQDSARRAVDEIERASEGRLTASGP